MYVIKSCIIYIYICYTVYLSMTKSLQFFFCSLSSSFRADYEEDSSSEESPPKRASYKGRFQELVGKVMCMESGDKRKSPLYVPVLVVLPDAHPVELKSKDHLLVRSFKDGKL